MKLRQDIYETYWKTAAQRQEIFFNKITNRFPITNNPIFSTYKFCNVYRASDRVSQFLIKNVIYNRRTKLEDTLFRIFLFRLLNRNRTWQLLEKKFGQLSLANFSFKNYSVMLNSIKSKEPIYGNAFILCANKVFGYDKKHQNHLALLEMIFKNQKIVNSLLNSKSLKELFGILRELPLIGDFMAYQIAIDFNYSEIFNFDENDFTIAGPGAERGIKKCFVDIEGKSSAYIIQYMVENQETEFDRLGIKFKNLFGRPMKAIDVQGWFCETDKYCRVKFPEIKSSRVKIKARYKPSNQPIPYFYPPKWGINNKVLS